MKIGIISDTHNYFDPRIPGIFSGVEHILHAGDIGQPTILYQLEEIAPVTAVIGNNDPDLTYRESENITLGGRRFLIHHIVNPRALSPAVQNQIERNEPDVVVFGHSHQPFNESVGGIVFFNPGYAGKPRFGHARSVAILNCAAGKIRADFIAL